MNNRTDKKSPLLIAALQGEKTERTPIWLMRQAGRYLPEYRALREKAGGFLNMVYNPELASEITLQPIRRFGMDGAILFSDILVIPQALGQELAFATGEGPQLGALDIKTLKLNEGILTPIYETLQQTRAKLNQEGFENTALIGFCGAPFTVACYMIEGGGSADFAKTRNFLKSNPSECAALIDLLVDASVQYLSKQIDAGAQAIQIFESWAGLLSGDEFARWVIAPTQKIVKSLRKNQPGIPVIGFPRAGAWDDVQAYARDTGIDGIGCDQGRSLEQMSTLQNDLCVQGNLNPELLLQGGAAMQDAARALLQKLSGKPFIFNLGHGVIKETNPDHVAHLVKLVQEYRS